jgi:hypothetical protein
MCLRHVHSTPEKMIAQNWKINHYRVLRYGTPITGQINPIISLEFSLTSQSQH